MNDLNVGPPTADVVPLESMRGSVTRKKAGPPAEWLEALRWAEAEVTRVARPEIPAGAPVEAIPQHARPVMFWGDLAQARFPPPDWLVRGFLERGKLGAIVGVPKSAKTWIADEVAISVATGLPAFESPDFDARQRPGKVFIWCVEDHAPDVQRRVRSLWAGRDTMPHDAQNLAQNLAVMAGQRVDLMTREQFLQCVATIRSVMPQPDLLVFDPFVDLVEFENENDARQVSTAVERFRIIRDVFKCAVLLVHHAKKGGGAKSKGADVDAARGSNAFMGKMDAWVILDGVETADDGSSIASDFRVTLKNGRRTPGMRTTLRIEDTDEGYAKRASWMVERKLPPAKVEAESTADLAARILDHLGKSGPTSADKLAVALSVGRAKARTACQELESTGHVVFVRRQKLQGYALPDAQFPISAPNSET